MQAVSKFGIYSGLVATAELDPTVQPFLYDHQIDGTAVLPGVMGVETFAEVAKLAFPDLAIAAIEDVNFMAPFKFYRDEPRTLEVAATFTVDGDDVIADCRLIGTRTLANQPEPQRTVHFTGKVRLRLRSPSWNPPRSRSCGAGGRRRRHLPDLLPRPHLPGAR